MVSRKSSYRDLEVWRKGCDLAVDVYRFTDGYPRREIYGLVSQMRECAASVPANIAEGKGRRIDGDFVRFLCIAAGSLAELETFLEISRRLGYGEEHQRIGIEEQTEEVGRMLQGLISAIDRNRRR